MPKHLQFCPRATVKILICKGTMQTHRHKHLQCLLQAIKLYCDFRWQGQVGMCISKDFLSRTMSRR